jgi:anti-anti-sigma factor
VDLSYIRIEHDEVVDLVLSGRIGADTCDDLQRAVGDELRRGWHDIRLDLAAVTFLSSAGIRGLFEVQRSAKSAGGTCFISQASPTVRKVLDLTRLTPILMGTPATALAASAADAKQRRPEDLVAGSIRLLGLTRPTTVLRGELIGSSAAEAPLCGSTPPRRPLPRQSFAFGLGGLADTASPDQRAGEFAALDGVAFHRPPHQHAAVDFMVPTGDLVAEADILTGLVWQGIPSGHAGFESACDEPAVRVDDLAVCLLHETGSEAIAVVAIGEVQGLIGAELIRPLAEVSDADSPWSAQRDTAARWLSFSREPAYPRHTAIVIGVWCLGSGKRWDYVRPIPGHTAQGHAHAVVFPYRPLRRGAADLAATIADLSVSEPLALMHLIADPHPILGSGCSELVRGSVWFAPLVIEPAPSGASL